MTEALGVLADVLVLVGALAAVAVYGAAAVLRRLERRRVRRRVQRRPDVAARARARVDEAARA